MYGVDISPSLISKITDRILPKIKDWQSRPLKEKYFLLWIDCIFYNIREDGQVRKKVIYVVLGIDLDGYKEILGFWIYGIESSRFWLGVLNDLKARGVRGVFIFSVDGLKGLDKAIEAAFSKADIQRYVVHQIRNSLRYVSWKEERKLANDLKKIYGSPTLELAEKEFEDFSDKWGQKYPHVVKSWKKNWEVLTTFFWYPLEIRRIMYKTNTIKNVNNKFKKATIGRRVFPRVWPSIYAQIAILFEDRL